MRYAFTVDRTEHLLERPELRSEMVIVSPPYKEWTLVSFQVVGFDVWFCWAVPDKWQEPKGV